MMTTLTFCLKLLLVSVKSLYFVKSTTSFEDKQLTCCIQLIVSPTCKSFTYSRIATTCGLQLDPERFTALRNYYLAQVRHSGPKSIRLSDLIAHLSIQISQRLQRAVHSDENTNERVKFISDGGNHTLTNQNEENIETLTPRKPSIPRQCEQEPTYVNQGAVRKQRLSRPGYPVVIEYECDQEKYKYLSGQREALCNHQGNWTLSAMICIPTGCYTEVVDRFGADTVLYGGDVNQDKDGRECQAWVKDKPQNHSPKNKVSGVCSGCGSVKDIGNKCRDLCHEHKPWCYTMVKGVRWRFCDIPLCTKERYCARPPISRGAPAFRTELIGQMVHVTYKCHADLKYLGGKNVSICNMEIGVWEWPDLLCASEKCYYYDRDQWKKGIYYGNVSTTQTGRTCQIWDSQTPHQHRLTATDFPGAQNLADLGNMCRDPDEEHKPWCFTTDTKERWGYCDVPECSLNI